LKLRVEPLSLFDQCIDHFVDIALQQSIENSNNNDDVLSNLPPPLVDHINRVVLRRTMKSDPSLLLKTYVTENSRVSAIDFVAAVWKYF
jgi:hypothetical protein